MHVHPLECQNCQSREVTNLIVRESGRSTRVFARCVACGELVASYQLRSFYQHGEGIDAYLREHGVGAGDSGRQWLADFETLKAETLESYEQAVASLEENAS